MYIQRCIFYLVFFHDTIISCSRMYIEKLVCQANNIYVMWSTICINVFHKSGSFLLFAFPSAHHSLNLFLWQWCMRTNTDKHLVPLCACKTNQDTDVNNESCSWIHIISICCTVFLHMSHITATLHKVLAFKEAFHNMIQTFTRQPVFVSCVSIITSTPTFDTKLRRECVNEGFNPSSRPIIYLSYPHLLNKFAVTMNTSHTLLSTEQPWPSQSQTAFKYKHLSSKSLDFVFIIFSLKIMESDAFSRSDIWSWKKFSHLWLKPQ